MFQFQFHSVVGGVLTARTCPSKSYYPSAALSILCNHLHLNSLILGSHCFVVSNLRSAWVVMPTVQSARQVRYAEEDLGSRF